MHIAASALGNLRSPKKSWGPWLSLLVCLATAPALWAATITVNSTADTAANDGVCTLREAITAANTNTASGAAVGECVAGAAAGVDDIVFNIAGAGVKLITPATQLPLITTPVHINGYTQPGASANSLVASSGSNAMFLIEIDNGGTPNAATLTVSGASAANSIIEGLALSRSANASCCANMGVYVTATSNVWIRGNLFGSEASGTVAKPFQDRAIYVDSNNDGVIIGSSTAALTPAYRNVIVAAGTGITSSGTANNITIRGNFVGTQPSGLTAISAGAVDIGIWLDNAAGASVVSDNVIAGTGLRGIQTRFSNGAVIERNLIGVSANGSTALGGNVSGGIAVSETTGAPLTNLTIRNNTVANGTGVGVLVARGTATNVVLGVAISQNVIRNNTGLGIDLSASFSADGVTANDALDADTGANNLQNFPVLATATGDAVNVATPYTFNSEPNQNFVLEFFRAATCNASGHGGAEVYLGSTNVTTDASGNAVGTASFASALVTGFISATATHAVNGTSEFSTCVTLNVPVVNVLLTVTKSGTGAGTVTGTGITCGADCTETVAQNTVVALTATATAGSTFIGWSGGGCSGTGACNVTMDAAKTVNAQFDVVVVPTFVLTVTKSGAGTGSVTGTGITCGADCAETLAQNTVVVLSGTATAGSTFIGWSGGGCTGTGACNVTMSAAQSVNAQFDLVVVPTFLLTVSKTGAGAGTITGIGIACGADCTEPFAQNTIVALTATPTAGSNFVAWTGACSGSGTCSVTMDATKTVNAQFDVVVVPTFVLTVTKAGAGTGSVTGTGITCGADCTETLAQNTVVALTATATAGSTFIGWSGGGCSGSGTCSVTMDATKTVNAQFDVAAVPTFLLTVSKSGTGAGTVTGTGISCGADCSESVAPNTVVTLTATAAVGSTFIGWSGGGCSGTVACSVTVSAATTVNAQFDITPVVSLTFSVSKSGTGGGTITGTGINCGVDCSEPLLPGTVLTLTATAAAGSTFIGWSGGACTGTGACVITIPAVAPLPTVNAQFDVTIVVLPNFVLNVSKSGSGSGTITGTGISCGLDCTESLAQNTVVTLTASPTAGSTFIGWSGAGCGGTGTCAVTMSAAQTVNAQFDAAAPPPAAVTVPSLHPLLLALLALLTALLPLFMTRDKR